MLSARESPSVWRASVLDSLGRASRFANSEPPTLNTVLVADLEQGAGQRLARAVWNSKSPIRVLPANADRMPRFAAQIAAGSCMPVGDRDYVQRAMAVAGLEPPAWNCYPAALSSHMTFRAHRTTASAALRWPKPFFVKPFIPGQFRGFILCEDPANMSEHSHQQLDLLLALPRREQVWVCAPLYFKSTWRYFVHQGDVLGYACISGRPEHEPELEEVSAIVAATPDHLAYALDMAVLDDGATTLLNARDAWGLQLPTEGLYAPEPMAFLRMLWSRWQDLCQPSRAAANGVSA